MSDSVEAPSPSNVMAAGIVWPLLCSVVVGLRFYTRRIQGARMLMDDWLTIPALVRVNIFAAQGVNADGISGIRF